MKADFLVAPMRITPLAGGGTKYKFSTTGDRDAFIGYYWPKRECMDSPGSYALPDGDFLFVMHLIVTHIPADEGADATACPVCHGNDCVCNPPRGQFPNECAIITAAKPTQYGVLEGNDIRVTGRAIEPPPTYSIIRFFRDGRGRKVVAEGMTRAEAEEHCSQPETSGDGWFDGFERED